MDNKISKWYYNGKEIDSIEEMKVHEPKVWGFVYLLTLYDLENKKNKRDNFFLYFCKTS